jgi:hypothetical protein
MGGRIVEIKHSVVIIVVAASAQIVESNREQEFQKL